MVAKLREKLLVIILEEAQSVFLMMVLLLPLGQKEMMAMEIIVVMYVFIKTSIIPGLKLVVI